MRILVLISILLTCFVIDFPQSDAAHAFKKVANATRRVVNEMKSIRLKHNISVSVKSGFKCHATVGLQTDHGQLCSETNIQASKQGIGFDQSAKTKVGTGFFHAGAGVALARQNIGAKAVAKIGEETDWIHCNTWSNFTNGVILEVENRVKIARILIPGFAQAWALFVTWMKDVVSSQSLENVSVPITFQVSVTAGPGFEGMLISGQENDLGFKVYGATLTHICEGFSGAFLAGYDAETVGAAFFQIKVTMVTVKVIIHDANIAHDIKSVADCMRLFDKPIFQQKC